MVGRPPSVGRPPPNAVLAPPSPLPQALAAAAAAVKASHPRVRVEASGGITEAALPRFLAPHVDAVSMGCLTHSAPALDFALRVLPADGDGDEAGGC